MADRVRSGIVGAGVMRTVHARADRRAGGVVFPESLWIGGREVNRQLLRGTSARPAAARYTVVTSGHPQGYQDCVDAFVADTHAAVAGSAPDGLPTFGDGVRAARITAAVLESAATQTWVEVAA